MKKNKQKKGAEAEKTASKIKNGTRFFNYMYIYFYFFKMDYNWFYLFCNNTSIFLQNI